MNDSERKVDVGQVTIVNAEYHCSFCCQLVLNQHNCNLTTVERQNLRLACDCELEKIAMYVEYERGAKEYAFECQTCQSINKMKTA